MSEYKKDYENVTVKPATKERLKSLGKMGDSMDTVITRLIDEHEQHTGDAQ